MGVILYHLFLSKNKSLEVLAVLQSCGNKKYNEELPKQEDPTDKGTTEKSLIIGMSFSHQDSCLTPSFKGNRREDTN